jgi:taurine dioxygenase
MRLVWHLVWRAMGRRVSPLTPAIGAEVDGLDLGRDLDAGTVTWLRRALLDHLVLFFRDQTLTPEAHLRLAQAFGAIELPAFRTAGMERPEILVLDTDAPKGQGTDRWHADATQREAPPMGSILRAVQLPDSGGDTCFASMYAAYESLSAPMQTFVDGLTAVHTDAMIAKWTAERAGVTVDRETGAAESVHPVVRVHPETGRKLLNVNGNWTSRIVELTEAESRAVLDLLFAAVRSPDVQCRFRWTPNAVAFWDNRAVQHYAVADYTQRRVMQRITIAGDRPRGPTDC